VDSTDARDRVSVPGPDVRKIVGSAIREHVSKNPVYRFFSVVAAVAALLLVWLGVKGDIGILAPGCALLLLVVWYLRTVYVAVFRHAPTEIGRQCHQLAAALHAAEEKAAVLREELEGLRRGVEHTRPFLLDSGTKVLTYRGRRNVAFGVDTINRVFHAFMKHVQPSERPDRCLFEVGFAAGHQFALDFNKEVVDPLRHRPGVVPPTFEEVRAAWDTYDDNVGFGDLQLGGLCRFDDGLRGGIAISRLFTADSTRLFGADATMPPHLDRCAWMSGYLAGFLNYADVIKPTAGHMASVVHTKCARTTGQLVCVFEVSTAPGYPP